MAYAGLNRRTLIGGAIAASVVMGSAASAALPECGPWHGRLSSDKEKPGFDDWHRLIGEGYSFHIYVDGVEQRNAEIVDSREGWVTRAKLDSSGHIYTLDDETIARETIYGKVKIFVVKAS